MANLLKTAFPHLTDNQIKITVQGLFNLDQDIPAFKDHLRDFLVQIRVSCSKIICRYVLLPYSFIYFITTENTHTKKLHQNSTSQIVLTESSHFISLMVYIVCGSSAPPKP